MPKFLLSKTIEYITVVEADSEEQALEMSNDIMLFDDEVDSDNESNWQVIEIIDG